MFYNWSPHSNSPPTAIIYQPGYNIFYLLHGDIDRKNIAMMACVSACSVSPGILVHIGCGSPAIGLFPVVGGGVGRLAPGTGGVMRWCCDR